MGDTKEISDLKSLAAILIVVIFAFIGSNLLSFLQGRNEFLRKFGISVKPVFKEFEIPDLIGSILFGLLARNAIGDFMDINYNTTWAENTRMICLVVILLRGGLELKFKGKATLVMLLSILPLTSEAMSISVISKPLLDVDWTIAFSLGFLLSAISPAVLVPNMLHFLEKKRGIYKGIPNSLIAASSFDVILAIILFGICSTIAVNNFSPNPKDPGMIIAKVIYELATGVGTGIMFGLFSYILRNQKSNLLRTLWLFILAVGITLLFYYIEFKQSSFISILTFGYVVKRVWNDEKPDKELRMIWSILKYFLFGTIGAALNLKTIKSSNVAFGFVIIICGSFVRAFVTFFIPSRKIYNLKERIFIAVSWIPKATVQAALGGIVLAEGVRLKSSSLQNDGEKLLTISVLAILLTAPLGSVLSYSIGEKYLSRFIEVVKSQELQNKDEEISHLFDIPENKNSQNEENMATNSKEETVR